MYFIFETIIKFLEKMNSWVLGRGDTEIRRKRRSFRIPIWLFNLEKIDNGFGQGTAESKIGSENIFKESGIFGYSGFFNKIDCHDSNNAVMIIIRTRMKLRCWSVAWIVLAILWFNRLRNKIDEIPVFMENRKPRFPVFFSLKIMHGLLSSNALAVIHGITSSPKVMTPWGMFYVSVWR